MLIKILDSLHGYVHFISKISTYLNQECKDGLISVPILKKLCEINVPQLFDLEWKLISIKVKIPSEIKSPLPLSLPVLFPLYVGKRILPRLVNFAFIFGKSDLIISDLYHVNTSYLTDSYISFTLKMESVSKNTIFGLKMMVKSGLEKFILKSLHAGR